MNSLGWLETLWHDLCFAVRVLRKTPGFTAVAVMALALGIGANTALFSLINAVMLRPLPVRDPQSLVLLKWSARQWPKTDTLYAYGGCPINDTGANEDVPEGCSISYPMFEQIRARNNLFSAIFAFAPFFSQLVVSSDGSTTLAHGEFVSGDFFPALRVRATLGRALEPSDDAPNAPPVVVLSYNYWQGQFGGSPSVIGHSILINRVPFSIVGVAPRGFLGIDPGIVHDVWLPLPTLARAVQHRPQASDAASWWVLVVARLKPGIMLAQAQASTQVIFTHGVTSGASPMLKLDDAPHIELVSVSRGLASLRKNFGDPLFVSLAAVGLVLLIVCTNMASLMLTRMAARQKELAVRIALGAKRWRILRQLLTESLLVAAAGGTLGILFAYVGASSLAAFLSANWASPLDIDFRPDVRVLGFTLVISVFTGVLFGTAPALRCSRVDVAPALKESAASTSWTTPIGRRLGLSRGLVVAQVSLAALMLVGASLLVRTLINLATVGMGFDAHDVIIFSVDPLLYGDKGERLASFFRELHQRLGAIPGVASVGYSDLPLIGGGQITQEICFPGEPDRSSQVDLLHVGPSFFETMSIPLLRGRTYESRDFEDASLKEPKVLIVNQTFVRRFLGWRDPIGQLISMGRGEPANVEIVGVVGDTKYNSLRVGTEPTIYPPLQIGVATFEVRTAIDPKALLPSIRDAVRSVDKNIPLSHLMTQTEQINRALFHERALAWLAGAFALVALTVTCAGLYGLLSFEVMRRTHEMGVRMALGASPAEVLGHVFGWGIRLVSIGVVIGIIMALGLGRYLESLLFGVRPIDPLAYGAVTIVLLLVTMSACYIPARRATKVDPMVALRYE